MDDLMDRYPNYLEPAYFARFLRQEFQRDVRAGQLSVIVRLKMPAILREKRDRSKRIADIAELIYRNIRQADFWSFFDNDFFISFSQCTQSGVSSCLDRLQKSLKSKWPSYHIPVEVKTYYDLMEEMESILENLPENGSYSKKSTDGDSDRMSFHAYALPLDRRLFDVTYDFDYQMFMKRATDLFFSFFFILLFLPLAIVISIAIFIDSPGPVFFRQKRVGLLGKPFYIYKFRTMRIMRDNDSEHQKLVKMILDGNGKEQEVKNAYHSHINSHLTRVGKFLRKTSLDEIPQIINILKNEMSFVGPRPHPTYEVEKYKKWYYQRLLVKPGLTGLSKIMLRFSPENYEEAMRMDIRYVREWSLKLDLKIILNTIKAIWVDYE